MLRPRFLRPDQARIIDDDTCTVESINETFEWANKENSADLQDKLAGQLGSAAAVAAAALTLALQP